MSGPAVILVTGASRGLGRGSALALAQGGFSVAIHYARNRDAGEEALAACRDAAVRTGQEFHLVAGDVGDPVARQGLFDQTLNAFGRLDGLVNNAGIAPRVRADLIQASEEVFDEVLAINLKGPYFLAQLAARHWLGRPGESRLGGGYKLVFVSSMSADAVSVNRGEYCISKAGLAMASRLWAARLAGDGVQVLELRPGIMETDMTAGVREKYDALLAKGLVPQNRWGQPADVGSAVRAIMENRFPFSTGDVINIDGGFHLRRL